MRELLRNWRILLLISLVILSFFVISFKGLKLGVDFEGGTLFQIHLAEKARDASEMNSIRAIIQQRMDGFGLKDTRVDISGDEYIIARIAETDVGKIEALEALLKTQGKFEATFDGNILFTGSDIIQILKSPQRGYGFREEGDLVRWNLPFSLKQSAAENFSRMVFHRCTVISYDPQSGNQYDCEVTYFFIDRPTNAVLIIPEYYYSYDKELLFQGNIEHDIPQETKIEELLLNAQIPYFIVDENLSTEQKDRLSELVEEKKYAIIPPTLDESIKEELISIGFKLREVETGSENYFAEPTEFGTQRLTATDSVPWIWQATGAKQVIALSPGITNWEPYVTNIDEARIFSELFITGIGSNPADAEESLKSLEIILETGKMPIQIESISKETISPLLGEEFLQNTFLIGVAALIVVSGVIFIRYRNIRLSIPLMFASLSEVVLILGVASFFDVNLDLAAVAGILAAVGTGVDSQIIITDELMRGEEMSSGSLLNRIKRAFFIIFAAAATTVATMSPIILFSFGLGKLVGFAITTITGVLIGVLISRPAYSEIAKFVLSNY